MIETLEARRMTSRAKPSRLLLLLTRCPQRVSTPIVTTLVPIDWLARSLLQSRTHLSSHAGARLSYSSHTLSPFFFPRPLLSTCLTRCPTVSRIPLKGTPRVEPCGALVSPHGHRRFKLTVTKGHEAYLFSPLHRDRNSRRCPPSQEDHSDGRGRLRAHGGGRGSRGSRSRS